MYVQVEVYQNILKLRYWTLAFTLHKTDRCLELVSLPHVLHDFRRKIFLTLYFSNRPDQIYSPDCLASPEIMGNMCIVIICCPVYDVANFEINRNLPIESHFYITKKSGQNCKYLKNKKSFWNDVKSIFYYF